MRIPAVAALTMLIALTAVPAKAEPASPPTSPDDLNITLRREAVQGLIQGATPYHVDLGSSLLKETLVFSEPRDLSFPNGKITFRIRCQGSPFPVDQVLQPVLSLRPAGSGGYQVIVQSLPLMIPGFGRVDLKDAFPPLDIQSLLSQEVFLQGRPAQLDVQLRRIAVRPDEIHMGASVRLKAAAR